MKQQQTGLVLLGAVLVAVILAALAYFLLIAPELDEATLAQEQAESARADNELLELNILQMQTLEQQVPTWREEVAKISLDMPPQVEQPEFIRLLTESLDAADLPLVDVTYARPMMVDPLGLSDSEPPSFGEDGVDPNPEPSPEPSPPAPPESDADTQESDPEAVEEPATPPAPTEVKPPFEGLYAIPVTVTTEGSPESVLSFVKSMWMQTDRFYTVSDFTVTRAAETDELPGRRALTEEDVVFQVTGFIFSLIDPERSFVPDNEGELQEYQVGDSATNSFAPLAGISTSGSSGDPDD